MDSTTHRTLAVVAVAAVAAAAAAAPAGCLGERTVGDLQGVQGGQTGAAGTSGTPVTGADAGSSPSTDGGAGAAGDPGVLVGGGTGDLRFLATNYPTGFNSMAVAIGDLNADGHDDVVVASAGANGANDGVVDVLINHGDGTLASVVPYDVFGSPTSVVVADLDGDGFGDVAVQDSGSASVRVLLNRGDGTLGPPSIYATDGYPSAVVAADVDGDGKLDLVTANGAGSASVLLNAGRGTFRGQVGYPAGLGTHGLVLADLNGDGKLDVVTANEGTPSADSGIEVLLNKGAGALGAPASYPLGAIFTYAVGAGDFDGNGTQDLVAVGQQSTAAHVFLGHGDGSFGAPASYAAGTEPISVAVGDLNGDRRPDIAFANYNMSGNGTANVLLNKGDGTFAPMTSYPAGFSPMGVAIGDLNGDGRGDIAVANEVGGSVTILLSSP